MTTQCDAVRVPEPFRRLGSVSFPSGGVRPRSAPATADAPHLSVSLHSTFQPFFVAGVLEREPPIRTVCLVDGRGNTLEDTVEDGYVLFLAEKSPASPLLFGLYDESGVLRAENALRYYNHENSCA